MNSTGSQLNLVDIIEPAAITSWPLAWGWWAVIIAALVILAAMTYASFVLVKRRKIRSLAFQLLQTAKDEYSNTGNANNYCRDINQSLKRYWTFYRPSTDVNTLSGKHWIEQLNQQTSAPVFNDTTATALIEGPYANLENFNPDTLEQAAINWIKQAKISRLKDTSGGVNV